MSTALRSLIECGTKLWLDSIDPEFVQQNRALGATGATSNPIIIADLVNSGRFDDRLAEHSERHASDEAVAWAMTDELVRLAQSQFRDAWLKTKGDDGYVSFELDPLIEDPAINLRHRERVERYIAEGRQWADGHDNRLIKVPATSAGIEALEPLVASGVQVNVTLIFTENQYRAARNSVWRGAQSFQDQPAADSEPAPGTADLWQRFKSVYSIFVSRIDVYTEKHCNHLSPAAQGQVGIVNAKRIWEMNRQFWAQHPTPLQQEIIFASTGTKRSEDPPWKYVQALAGSDIQTNPPATNEAVAQSDLVFENTLNQPTDPDLLAEICSLVNFDHMQTTLMREGVAKFADPQHALLKLIREKRRNLAEA